MTNLACSNNGRIHTTRTLENVICSIVNQQHMTFHLYVLWVGFLSFMRPRLYNIRWQLSEVGRVVASLVFNLCQAGNILHTFFNKHRRA